MQYGIRLRSETEMSWGEFSTLLAGIMPETPLGQMVDIRREEDKDMLKIFNKEQHRIRNKWRDKQMAELNEEMTEEEKKEQVAEIQKMFKSLFGNV